MALGFRQAKAGRRTSVAKLSPARIVENALAAREIADRGADFQTDDRTEIDTLALRDALAVDGKAVLGSNGANQRSEYPQ